MYRNLSDFHKIEPLIKRGALFVINDSGGKDSQCTKILLNQLIPKEQLLIIHAHLPGVEWEGTQEHIKRFSNDLPVIITIATKTFFQMVDRRQNWPAPKQRQCTSDLKRGPIERDVRRYIKKHNLSGLVVNCMGMRAQESSNRAKKNPFVFNKRNSKAGREWYDWLPIHKLKIEQVFDTIRKAGQEPHWAYSKGMSRLSCCFCIMANQNDLWISSKINNELFNKYVEKEKEIGKTVFMKNGKPIGLEKYVNQG